VKCTALVRDQPQIPFTVLGMAERISHREGLQNSDLEIGNREHLERNWAFKQLGRMFDALTEPDLR
jgi:hypothetical protein